MLSLMVYAFSAIPAAAITLLRNLSTTYSKAEQNGMAALATAERYALEGHQGMPGNTHVALLPNCPLVLLLGNGPKMCS